MPRHRIYLDECASGADWLLRRAGHGVVLARAVLARGSSDPKQLFRATLDRRIFVTLNHRDFRLVHEAWLLAGGRHSGIISSRGQVADFEERVLALLARTPAEDFQDRLVIWDPTPHRWVVARI